MRIICTTAAQTHKQRSQRVNVLKQMLWTLVCLLAMKNVSKPANISRYLRNYIRFWILITCLNKCQMNDRPLQADPHETMMC